ncbi:hypothetical protein MYVALT_F_01050 [Candidatus Vallotia tarda]|uniref:Uncharacterized protein n=1 Tax=Candidatus Vallotiella hemipterorum TaxID=1177213 RepID=A0A916JSL7_9BURK|nr:hypothetical protein MYVALT_F_01050 [Candidatus Vallotia tarda]
MYAYISFSITPTIYVDASALSFFTPDFTHYPSELKITDNFPFTDRATRRNPRSLQGYLTYIEIADLIIKKYDLESLGPE